MIKFSDLEFFDHADNRGIYCRLFFPNGYGVSIIKGPYTYGGDKGKYELAVLVGTEEDYKLCYDTPITSDVLGHLSEEEVEEYVKKVNELPPLRTAV